MSNPSNPDPRFARVQGLGPLIKVFAGDPRGLAYYVALGAYALWLVAFMWWAVEYSLSWSWTIATLAPLGLASMLVAIAVHWARRSASESRLPGTVAIFEHGLAVYDGGKDNPVEQFPWESISNVESLPTDENKPAFVLVTIRDGTRRALYAGGPKQDVELVAAIRAAVESQRRGHPAQGKGEHPIRS